VIIRAFSGGSNIKNIMGREAKLKKQRKLERLYREEKRRRTRRRIFRLTLGILGILGVLGLGLWGFVFLDMKYWHLIFGRKGQVAKLIGDHKYSQAPSMTIDTNRNYLAIISTSKGDIKVKLFAKDAPVTVNNFVFLAREKFYNGLLFHRVIPDFMIQGGDPKGDGSGDPGYKFEDEINAKSLGLSETKIKDLEAQGYKFTDKVTSHKMVRGVLAMANSGPSSNGSQFFIVTKAKADWLDGKHTVFGEVTEGMEVADAISNVPRDKSDKPKEPVTIKSITIIESMEFGGGTPIIPTVTTKVK
jgi:cyclophilin family peptidyl-prolyl cis-trans isomerase